MLVFNTGELLQPSELQQYVAIPTPANAKLIAVQASWHRLFVVLDTSIFVVSFLKYKLLVCKYIII